MPNSSPINAKIARISRLGESISTIGLLIFVGFLIYAVWSLVSNQPWLNNEIKSAFDLDDWQGEIRGITLWLGAFFFFVPQFIGVTMVFTVRKLFIGFRTDGVFVETAAKRLNLIGWLLIWMVPIMFVLQGVATMVLTASDSVAGGQIILSIEDTDVYALVVGCTLVAVSYVFAEAIRLAEENRGFI